MGVYILGRGNVGVKRECEGGGICCFEGERRDLGFCGCVIIILYRFC